MNLACLLTIFIVLKLCNLITWSWIWVLSPFWIPLGVCSLLSLIFGVTITLKGRD